MKINSADFSTSDRLPLGFLPLLDYLQLTADLEQPLVNMEPLLVLLLRMPFPKVQEDFLCVMLVL